MAQRIHETQLAKNWSHMAPCNSHKHQIDINIITTQSYLVHFGPVPSCRPGFQASACDAKAFTPPAVNWFPDRAIPTICGLVWTTSDIHRHSKCAWPRISRHCLKHIGWALIAQFDSRLNPHQIVAPSGKATKAEMADSARGFMPFVFHRQFALVLPLCVTMCTVIIQNQTQRVHQEPL